VELRRARLNRAFERLNQLLDYGRGRTLSKSKIGVVNPRGRNERNEPLPILARFALEGSAGEPRNQCSPRLLFSKHEAEARACAD
jgi:hypothetical protein